MVNITWVPRLPGTYTCREVSETSEGATHTSNTFDLHQFIITMESWQSDTPPEIRLIMEAYEYCCREGVGLSVTVDADTGDIELNITNATITNTIDTEESTVRFDVIPRHVRLVLIAELMDIADNIKGAEPLKVAHTLRVTNCKLRRRGFAGTCNGVVRIVGYGDEVADRLEETFGVVITADNKGVVMSYDETRERFCSIPGEILWSMVRPFGYKSTKAFNSRIQSILDALSLASVHRFKTTVESLMCGDETLKSLQ